MGMETVAVHSDVDAHALHVQEATTAVALGGNASGDSYLRADKIIAAAMAGGADAVHPGYGFLSENAAFAQAVIDAGLVWVGPPPPALRTLGNKATARRLALARGIPCLAGYEGADQSDDRLGAEAQSIGFPVMVKAAAGGGGRGMRLVTQPGELLAALRGARSEAHAAFGSGELLLERALLEPRHVEVQVFADAHGHCIQLGERDCSLQRRHQKLIEETPGPAVSPQLRERLTAYAVDLARAADYVGAATVEFLVEGGECYLMEVNARLQVEHPVTEAVTGLDLVEWQLRVAQGESLPLAQEKVRFRGHAIEVRLCAEDEDFAPHTGTVRHFRAPPTDGELRFDHAIFEGLEVSSHYDSMLGKLVVHAPTRDEAIDRLAGALDRMQLLGLPSNRRFLAACLRHPVFRAGGAVIPFIQRHGAALRLSLEQQEAQSTVDAALAAVFGGGGSAVSLPCPFAKPVRLRHRDRVLAFQVRSLADGALEVEEGGRTRRVVPQRTPSVRIEDGRWHVQAGSTDLVIQDASFLPGDSAIGTDAARELRAPFNGKVIRVAAQPGAFVARGETLLVLESMKLEHALSAARDAVVERVHVAAGQQAATSQLLVTFEAAP
jgi:geranyl-CoA carboxylase alpha subunit